MVAGERYNGHSVCSCFTICNDCCFQCLYWFELPFMEDVRQFTFGSLPKKEENPSNKKFKPSGNVGILSQSLCMISLNPDSFNIYLNFSETFH